MKKKEKEWCIVKYEDGEYYCGNGGETSPEIMKAKIFKTKKLALRALSNVYGFTNELNNYYGTNVHGPISLIKCEIVEKEKLEL